MARVLWIGPSLSSVTTDGGITSEIAGRLVDDWGCSAGLLTGSGDAGCGSRTDERWVFHRSVADPFSVWHLEDALARSDPDVIITISEVPSLGPARAILSASTSAWVACLHPLAPGQASALPGALSGADRVLAFTEATAQAVRAALPGLPVDGVGLGVDRDAFRPLRSRDRLRTRAGLAGRFVVGCLAWHSDPAELAAVLKGFANLRGAVGEASLCVTTLRSEAEAGGREAAQRLGIAEAVQFLSPDATQEFHADPTRLNELLALFDAVVLPALDWPDAAQVLQARAAGLPVLAPAHGEFHGLLGYEGIRLGPESDHAGPDPAALGEALRRVHAGDRPHRGEVRSWEDAWGPWQEALRQVPGLRGEPASPVGAPLLRRPGAAGPSPPGESRSDRVFTPFVVHGDPFVGDRHGSASRAALWQLHRQGVVVDLRPAQPSPELGAPWRDDRQRVYHQTLRNQTGEGRRVNLSLCDPSRVLIRRDADDYNILHVVSDTPGVPPAWLGALNRMDEIWTTHPNLDRFRAAGVATPVHEVFFGADPDLFRPGLEPLSLPTQGRVTFLWMGAWNRRNGADVLLASFTEAFAPGEPVCLACKVPPRQGDAIRQHLAALGQSARVDRGQIIIIEEWLAEAQLARLHAAADCLVVPARVGGVAPCLLEAQACGVPVIATDWGDLGQAASDGGALLIGCRARVAGGPLCREDPSLIGQEVAEPDPEHLRTLLRQVAADPAAARQTAATRTDEAAVRSSWERAGQAIHERLVVATEALVQRRPPRPRHPATRRVESIALIQPVSLGDVVMLDALIRGLRHDHEGARITVITRPEFAPILNHKPVTVRECQQYLVHETDPATLAAVYRALPDFDEVGFVPQADFLGGEHFDRIINLRCCRVVGESLLGHFCGLAGVPDAFPYTVDLTAEERAWADGELRGDGRPRVGLHYLGSRREPWRSWPAEEAAALCQLLRGEGVAVTVFGGPGDEHLGLPFVDDRVGRATIRETMALVSACDVMVTVDSAVMHIALALGKPLVSLWCGADRNPPGFILRPQERLRLNHTLLMPHQLKDAGRHVLAHIRTYTRSVEG